MNQQPLKMQGSQKIHDSWFNFITLLEYLIDNIEQNFGAHGSM
jgi:hypothetical protein